MNKEKIKFQGLLLVYINTTDTVFQICKLYKILVNRNLCSLCFIQELGTCTGVVLFLLVETSKDLTLFCSAVFCSATSKSFYVAFEVVQAHVHQRLYNLHYTIRKIHALYNYKKCVS